jgi:hypothetical protein
MKRKLYSVTFRLFLLLVVGIFITNYLGCKKEAEKPVEKTTPQTQVTTAPAETTKVVEKPKVVYPDLTGKWSGTLYNRTVSFNINKQDTTDFSGSLTIFFRDNINQQVSGKVDPSNLKIKMKDLVHNKAMGTYSGKLSEDSKTMSGTFTMNADKKAYTFNFVKK